MYFRSFCDKKVRNLIQNEEKIEIYAQILVYLRFFLYLCALNCVNI